MFKEVMYWFGIVAVLVLFLVVPRLLPTPKKDFAPPVPVEEYTDARRHSDECKEQGGVIIFGGLDHWYCIKKESLIKF